MKPTMFQTSSLFVAALLLLLAILTAAATVNNNNVFTARDLRQLKRLGGAAVSPDGKFVAYSLRSWDPATNKTANHLEMIDIASGSTKPVTKMQWGQADSSPVWSPDSLSVLFLRGGQIWSVSVSDPNTVTQVSKYPVDVNIFKWSHIGNFIVFSADVYADCEDLQCTANRDASVAARGPNTYFVYDHLYVRHWDQWSTGKVSHLFVQKIKYSSTVYLDGAPYDTMAGMRAESPITPFGGAEQFDVAPDGSEIAFNLDMVDSTQAFRTNWRIYTIGLKNGVPQLPAKWLTSNIEARTQNPLYSPDGTGIAYLAMDRPGLESDRLHLEVYNRTNGRVYQVTDKWDRTIADYSWIGNRGFFMVAADDGMNKLFSCANAPSAEVRLEVSCMKNQNAPTYVPGSNAVYMTVRSSFMHPTDVYTFSYANGEVENYDQLTFVNKDAISKFEMVVPEIFHFGGSLGHTVQGWLFKPANFDPSKKYPVAHLIHGGPEGIWASSWSTKWNPQMWTHAGFAVVLINPAGSTGQGQAFTDLVRDNWGSYPYDDLMNGLDYVLSKNSWLDPKNLHANGASYGGYMINWINGHTDRYRSLVCHDGVFDTMSMYYVTEEVFFAESEYCPIKNRGCKPWQPQFTAGFEKFNPRNYVANWKTPTLVIHGGLDYRISESEGIAAFTALQSRGIKSRFLYFPREPHWVSNSANSLAWFDNVLGWIKEHSA